MSGRESWSRSEAEKATGRSKSELAGVVIPGTLGRHYGARSAAVGRDSTIDAQAGSRPRASRFRGVGALAVS